MIKNNNSSQRAEGLNECFSICGWFGMKWRQFCGWHLYCLLALSLLLRIFCSVSVWIPAVLLMTVSFLLWRFCMAVLVLVCGEKWEKFLSRFRVTIERKDLDRLFFSFSFSFLHPPCLCMSTTLISFMFFFFRDLRSQGVIRRTGAAKVFSRAKADIPRKWFLFYGGHVH